MGQKFWSRKEVADFLRVSVGTLSNYGCRHEVYKPDNAGAYYYRHVEILEKVHAKILSPTEGLERWTFIKMDSRNSVLPPLKKKRQGKKGAGKNNSAM